MSNKTVADRILEFLAGLQLNAKLPKGVQVLNPYADGSTFALCRAFYNKYYNDHNERTLLVGINPGRFGSGTTGISFTDPVKLQNHCGIVNDLPKKPELSADFIYKMIGVYGGPDLFFRDYFISAVSPLGFTMNGVNINYYDIPSLQSAVTPFIISSINQMLALNISRKKCFCIGEGKNLKFLTALNRKHEWFQEIVPLSHPRFIMQYKRRKVDEYIDAYLSALNREL